MHLGTDALIAIAPIEIRRRDAVRIGRRVRWARLRECDGVERRGSRIRRRPSARGSSSCSAAATARSRTARSRAGRPSRSRGPACTEVARAECERQRSIVRRRATRAAHRHRGCGTCARRSSSEIGIASIALMLRAERDRSIRQRRAPSAHSRRARVTFSTDTSPSETMRVRSDRSNAPLPPRTLPLYVDPRAEPQHPADDRSGVEARPGLDALDVVVELAPPRRSRRRICVARWLPRQHRSSAEPATTRRMAASYPGPDRGRAGHALAVRLCLVVSRLARLQRRPREVRERVPQLRRSSCSGRRPTPRSRPRRPSSVTSFASRSSPSSRRTSSSASTPVRASACPQTTTRT